MSKIVAIEWDVRELRMVVGHTSGSDVIVEGIDSVRFDVPVSALSRTDASDNKDLQQHVPSDATVADALKQLALRNGVAGAIALVNIPRGKVEIRNLTLPAVAAEELPDMVRFAALRQFANLGDTWPIDFVLLPRRKVDKDGKQQPPPSANDVLAAPTDSLEVLATAIAPSSISSIRKIASDAGLQLGQIGLRPLSTASLAILPRQPTVSADETVLLIDIAPDEAELILMEGKYASFVRTVRLHAANGELIPFLSAAEVKRTLIAAMNSRGLSNVDRIVLWGSELETAHTLKQWQAAVTLPIQSIDPRSLLRDKAGMMNRSRGGDMDQHSTQDDRPGRFSALLGLIHQYKAKTDSKKVFGMTLGTVDNSVDITSLRIDYLEPRRRPPEAKPFRQYILAGTAATLLFAMAIYWYRSSHATLDAEIAELQSQLSSKDGALKIADKNSKEWGKIRTFLEGDIQWLDELAYLSEKALPSEQLVLIDAAFAMELASNRGFAKTQAVLTESDLEPKLEQQWRDQNHQVGAKGVNRSNDVNANYPWIVEPELLIKRNPDVDPTAWKKQTPAVTDPPKNESNKAEDGKAKESLEVKNDAS